MTEMAKPEAKGDGSSQARTLGGRHGLVTGGGRGIGASVAESLAGLGADLTLCGRNLDVLEGHAGALREKFGVRVVVATADVTDAATVQAAFERAAEEISPPDILINSAGAARSAPFARTDAALWHEMLDINLTGAYLCIQAALPHMIDGGFGRIVNVASTAGLKGYAYIAAYCAAKHGLIGLTRALAAETASKGVTVNAVCPGYTDTDMTRDTIANIVAKTGRTEQEAMAGLTAPNLLGRLIMPEEVAQAVANLCLPASAAVTGQSILVAGGEIM